MLGLLDRTVISVFLALGITTGALSVIGGSWIPFIAWAFIVSTVLLVELIGFVLKAVGK